MSNLSVRGLEPETLSVLKARARQEGASVNALVLRLIEQALGRVSARPVRHRYHDLDALAGIWSAEEAAVFEDNSADFRKADADLWK